MDGQSLDSILALWFNVHLFSLTAADEKKMLPGVILLINGVGNKVALKGDVKKTILED